MRELYHRASIRGAVGRVLNVGPSVLPGRDRAGKRREVKARGARTLPLPLPLTPPPPRGAAIRGEERAAPNALGIFQGSRFRPATRRATPGGPGSRLERPVHPHPPPHLARGQLSHG